MSATTPPPLYMIGPFRRAAPVRLSTDLPRASGSSARYAIFIKIADRTMAP